METWITVVLFCLFVGYCVYLWRRVVMEEKREEKRQKDELKMALDIIKSRKKRVLPSKKGLPVGEVKANGSKMIDSGLADHD